MHLKVYAALTLSILTLDIMASRCVLWFRNNLRVTDNPVFSEFTKLKNKPTEVVCLFCFDDRYYGKSKWGAKRTDMHRAKFLLESVEDLRSNLRSLGNDLVVSMERPEDIIPKIFVNGDNILIYQKHFTAEEVFI